MNPLLPAGVLPVGDPPAVPVSFFAVLGGYQAAANVDPDSNGAFAFDMGYVLFSRPALNAEWADFADTPDTLTIGNPVSRPRLRGGEFPRR